MISRRSFLSGFGLTVPAVGAARVTASASPAQSAPAATEWRPARHAQDDWLDAIPGKHRLVFDTTTADGFGQALLYVNNYIGQNVDAYSLADADLAVVIIARHRST